jgi:WS/DGAT/MGAT family acyltransferase
VRRADRLTALDNSFLELERDAAHMHVAACAVFEGPAPDYELLVRQIVSRLHLVPRYRQRLAFVPLGQGRPVWVDDPHFNATYHVRDTALPRPGGEDELKRLAGRVFSQALDRARPLWEIWLVEGLEEDRFALLFKTHHALVDGIAGLDMATVLFDNSAEQTEVAARQDDWIARPPPSAAQLLADALLERATVPGELFEGIRSTLRGPQVLARRLCAALEGVAAMVRVGLAPAPRSPFNVRIGPHRRFTWVRAELAGFRTIKAAFGGTVNDAVLSTVAGGLGRYLRLHGHRTDGLVLKAMAPVSVRAEPERGALGNRVAAMWAPLPVGITDPVRRLRTVSQAMDTLKESGQAVGAQVLTQLSGFAPATIMSQAARLQAHQRLFNLTVTNIPGPQAPMYLLGRELLAVYPMVPLAENTALGIAVLSYDGQLDFGLTADYDAIADVDTLAAALRESIVELLEATADRIVEQR